MLKIDHVKGNTLYLCHGRHGSQSLERLTNSSPEFIKLERMEDSVVMSDHFRGKVRMFTREPLAKFTSGLSWYLGRAHGLLMKQLHGENRYLIEHEPDYATTQRILSAMMFSSATMEAFDMESYIKSL